MQRCAALCDLHRCGGAAEGDATGSRVGSDELPSIAVYNPSHAAEIVLLGSAQLQHLDAARHRRALFDSAPALLVLVDGVSPPAWLIAETERRAIELWATALSAARLRWHLYPQLQRMLAPACDVHGVLVELDGVGTLLSGPAGVGKGSVALELLGRGHRLIADDTVHLVRTVDGALCGDSPGRLSGFLFVRGLGVIDVVREFGVRALALRSQVRQVIDLRAQAVVTADATGQAELHGEQIEKHWLGVAIPGLLLRGQIGAADRVEAYTRRHLLARLGHKVPEAFCDQQRSLLKSGRET